mmetsp:Transcript_29898/g.96477  ORF Transcript_29898/g.96477 Transcript_29898/m.96477 type:complete len:247 (-) Transcript_29898:108-848(-)
MLGGKKHVLKHQLGRGRRPHATFILEPLPQAEAGHPLLDIEKRHRARRPLGRAAGAGVNQESVTQLGVGDGSICDPHLAAVEFPGTIGKAQGGSAHAEHVRAMIWFRHPHSTHSLAGAGGGQPRLALLGGAVTRQVVREELRVRQVRQAEGRVRRGQLLMNDRRGRRVHPGATVLGRDGDAEQAQLARPAKEGLIEPLLPVVHQRLRFNFLPHKRGAQRAERRVLGCRRKEGARGRLVIGSAGSSA